MSNLLSRTLGEGKETETVLAGGLWTVSADIGQLENALLNLAVNTRDAMPNGGKLAIETGNVFLDEAYASAQAEVAPGQYVMIAMTDNGVGMSDEVIERACEPVLQHKRSRSWHWPWSLPGLWVRQAIGRARQDLQCDGRGDDGQALPAVRAAPIPK